MCALIDMISTYLFARTLGLHTEEGTAVATSVTRLHDVLLSRSSLTPALTTIALMDYIEEILTLIWGESKVHPLDAYLYVTQCLTADEVMQSVVV